MKISKNGLIELANYEALSNTVYLDSGGVRTVGIGMTVSEIPDIRKWSWDKRLETQECVQMYQKALIKYEDAVNKAIHPGIEILQHQFDALVSITYNIGVGAMAKSTFMKRINAGESSEDVVAAMKRFNVDNGKVVQGLVNRRNAEGKIYLNGKYTHDGMVTHIEVNPNNHHPIYKGRISISEYII